MEVLRCCNYRLLVVFSSFAMASFAIGTLLYLKNSGVREVPPTCIMGNEEQKDPAPAQDDWPWWRGTNGGNRVEAAITLPLQWSGSENVVWKTSVPGRGHSSPCLWGQRMFLSTSSEENPSISLLCLDRDTGSRLWETELHRGGFGECHKKNTNASATPACDGRFVYVASPVRGSIWVTAVDFNGQIAWCREAGPFAAEWGYGSSLAIHKSLVIVNADNRGSGIDRLVGASWLGGLHRGTGKILWRIKRPEGDSFGSPIVASIAGRDQLLLAGKEYVISYDPTTGATLWKCRWGATRTANTVAFDDLHVYASAKQPQSEMICIRADGSGDVSDTHVVWREQKSACDVPSICVSKGCLYSLNDDGILTCLTSADGKMIWKRRLGGNMSASPLIVGEHLYCSNEQGTTYVVDITRRGEIVAENSLSDGIMASPIVGRDCLYLRTLTGIYCLAAKGSTSITDQSDFSSRRF